MSGQLAVGGACLIVAVVGTVLLARYWPAHPARGGRHRAPAAATSVPGLVSVEALVYEVVQCPVCCRATRHVRFALGGLMCLTCRHWEA